MKKLLFFLLVDKNRHSRDRSELRLHTTLYEDLCQ